MSTSRRTTTRLAERRARIARYLLGLALAAGAALPSLACSNINEDVFPADAGANDGAANANPVLDAGDGATFSLEPFTPPGDPGGGGVTFAASGEALALTGYAFPPASTGDPVFVDGWEVKFSHLLVTIDKVTLSERPDFSPGDPSQTGAVVAEVDGPWAVDLAKNDPSYLPGKGGPGERAVPFAAIAQENAAGSGALVTDGTRYAFGFDAVRATSHAKNVNLDLDALADYLTMVQGGCTVFYDGVATFKGDASCSGGDYATWPKSVHFALCFRAPTSYLNCQNPDNQGSPFPNEEAQRGIALQASHATLAQVTFHTDHPFWDSVVHDSPAHFDQFAARVLDRGDAPTVTLDDVAGVDFTSYTDSRGKPLAWRYCVEPPTDAHPKLVGAMAFDPGSVPHAAAGDDASKGLRDYYDFSTYDQSTQGHLNSDGLCFVRRNYPSPR